MTLIDEILDVTPRFTELNTSRIGLGMAAIGRPGYINLGHSSDIQHKDYQSMKANAYQMLDEAYSLGVRYFDTAASYGAGEQFLGDWVSDRGYKTPDITVSSKWGYNYTADWQVEALEHEVKEHSLNNLNRTYVLSCLHLGRPMLIYQIHSATFESGVLENSQVLGRLAEIKDAGRLIGLTVSGPQQSGLIEKAVEVTVDGNPLFGLVQATWNLLEPSSGHALKLAHDSGMAVVIKESMANGRLTQRNSEPEFANKLQQLDRLANELECEVEQLPLLASVNQPWCDVALSGASNLQQLRSNLSVMNISWDNEVMEELKVLAEAPELYWKLRSELKWN